jgi:predicted AAA+ superfamily ATPase
MDQITLQVLLGHNPWLLDRNAWPKTLRNHLPERFIPRHLTSPLKSDNNKINLVIGPRQSGKSTLIWHYLAAKSQPFLLINCEEPSCRELCKSPALFLTSIKEIASPIPGLFFEEIQHLSEAGLFLKGLVDLKPNVPIFVTGSSSYHLRSKTRESLAGRADRHLLLPFGMAELQPEKLPSLITEEKAALNWKELLIWGGYPEVVLNQDKQAILAQLVEAFVLRDASDIYRIKRPDASVGVSVNTVIEYINLMVESHLVKLVGPFVGGKRAEVTSTPKIFFMDNGLRNLLFGGFAAGNQRADLGALTENLVFTELCKHTNPLLDTILYWRSSSGAEVDFIIRTAEKLTAIEVKAGSLKRPKISRSLRSFIQAYRPDKVFIFNETLVDSQEIEGSLVIFDRLIHIPTMLHGGKN